MLLLLAAVLALQAPLSCPDAAACRTEAEAAAARGEFETFHDLAWRTVQKGRPNDPALMFLVARAQALSGRLEDALVMLGRLADMRAPIDLTLSDFDRVRQRPGWAALESRVTGTPAPAAPAPAAPRAPVAPAPGAPAAPDAPAPRAPLAPDAPRSPDAPLDFDPPAGFAPLAMAYDAVSRRFVVGDPPSRRLLVIDEVSRHVVPYVSAASAGFYDDLTGLAVDDRRGDLWVVSATGTDSGASSILHKLQLVSGRVLMDVRPGDGALPARFVDVAVAADGTVFALDAAGGRVFRVRPGSRALEVAQRIEARGLTALAAADDHTVFVATESGVLRLDVTARTAQAIKGVDDLGGFTSLAWRNGALVGVQHAQGTWLVVRVAVDASGTRAQPRAILAASPSPIVGSLAGGSFYYVADRAIRRVAVR